MPDYSVERMLYARGAREIAGVDEAGRGPLAGPVTAAAVVLDANALPSGINDSKKLGPKARDRLLEEIVASAKVSVAHASVEEIDKLNILHASLLAMERAVAGLSGTPDHVLIDGNVVPGSLGCSATALVKGDARSLSVAAASIAAKIARDRIMEDLAREFPGYGWERNAGYPTKAHREALAVLGITPHHRRSFKTVRELL
ncbi:MAG: ribonuclease HII [Boseongicola sp. SB0662_bin_57]|nr:ribonuclease HII [Boseongicola sp. SB0662_bin_57]